MLRLKLPMRQATSASRSIDSAWPESARLLVELQVSTRCPCACSSRPETTSTSPSSRVASAWPWTEPALSATPSSSRARKRWPHTHTVRGIWERQRRAVDTRQQPTW